MQRVDLDATASGSSSLAGSYLPSPVSSPPPSRTPPSLSPVHPSHSPQCPPLPNLLPPPPAALSWASPALFLSGHVAPTCVSLLHCTHVGSPTSLLPPLTLEPRQDPFPSTPSPSPTPHHSSRCLPLAWHQLVLLRHKAQDALTLCGRESESKSCLNHENQSLNRASTTRIRVQIAHCVMYQPRKSESKSCRKYENQSPNRAVHVVLRADRRREGVGESVCGRRVRSLVVLPPHRLHGACAGGRGSRERGGGRRESQR